MLTSGGKWECPSRPKTAVRQRLTIRRFLAKGGRSADASEHPARLAGCPCRGGFMRNCFAVRRPQIGAAGCLAMLWCLAEKVSDVGSARLTHRAFGNGLNRAEDLKRPAV